MLVNAETIKLSEKDIRLTHQSALHPPEHQKVIEQIIIHIFSYSYINSIPKSLANRTSPVRREELLSYLNFFHQNAINAISKEFISTMVIPIINIFLMNLQN